MAFHVILTKCFEDQDSARYRFESDGGEAGTLAIKKSSGEVTVVEPLPGDEKGHVFSRAAAKIRKEWKAGRLPDATEWAS